MAVVPNGWAYKRGETWYEAGQTMPSPPIVGDFLYRVYRRGTDVRTFMTIYRYTDDIYIKEGSYITGWVMGYDYTVYNDRQYIGDINSLIFDEINGEDVVGVDVRYYSFSNADNNVDIDITKLPSRLIKFEARSYGSYDIVTLNSFSISTQLPSSLKHFDVSLNGNITTTPSLFHTNIKNLNSCFVECINLETITDFPNNLESLSNAFSKCSKLVNIPNIPNTIKNLSTAFEYCTSLVNAPTMPSNITECTTTGSFRGCSKLANVDNFILPNGASYYAFQDCTNLVDASKMMIQGIILSATFKGCTSLKYPPSIPSRVTTISSIFEDCESLEYIPDIPFNAQYCSYSFKNCKSVEYVNLIFPSIETLLSTLEGCEKLSGVIGFLNISGVRNSSDLFKGTTHPILIFGDYDHTMYEDYNNVYTNPITELSNLTTTRCNLDGTLNDEGRYVKLAFNFEALDFDATLYVPKVYVRNAQQEPQVNWVYIDPEGVRHEVPNSRDIEVDYIEAASLSTTGSFETIFLAGDDTVEYSIYLPTSMENIAQGYDNQGNVIRDRYYWNLLSGKAIFTGKDYIFDATPDGKSFKIGGPVDEENEKGFIVGNRGIPLLADQYPSTFNGPVTFNSEVYGLGEHGIAFGKPVEIDSLFDVAMPTRFNDYVQYRGGQFILRGIFVDTQEPTSTDGEDGDIWLVYEE